MSLPPASDSSQRSNSVGVHGNQFTTGAVLATEQTRSITTAATGLKNEVENNTISYNTIYCAGDYNHSVQGATNSNRQESSEGRLTTPLSPSQTTPLNNTTGLLSSPTAFQDAATSRSFFSDLHSPGPESFNFLQRPEMGGPQTWADHFEEAGKRIKDTCEDVLQKVDATRARRSGQQKKQLKRDIELQRDIFARVTKSLITTLMAMSPEQQELDTETKCLCDGACDALDSVWAQIHNLRVNVERFRTAEHKKKKQDLADCFNSLVSHIDTFEKAIVSMIPRDPIPQPPTTQMDAQNMRLELQEVEKLSVEGRVSSMLHQCLCRACPEQCHDLHTTYLSLQPEDMDATPLSSPSDIARVIWQCHMAFRSTIAKDPFIWLRVVSSVVGSAENPFTEASLEAPEQSEIHSSETTAESTENNPRKRRAASTPLEPPLKAPKLRSGQSVRRISEPAPPPSPPSRFEVCPELLAQHDLDTVVMNFTDDCGHNHNIFYLPKEKRPINSAAGDPITLSAMLGKRQGRHTLRDKRNKYILRLSRLIAEAVLRFDLRDSDPSPEKCVVFYELPHKDMDLAPFLKKVIRKPDHAVDAEDNSASRRSDLLANLGHVLLQLGLVKETRVRDDPPQDLRGRRSYIKRVAPDVQTHMGAGYLKVIQQCISLSALGGDTGGTFEEGFKQSYYHGIVKPLREMERCLQTG